MKRNTAHAVRRIALTYFLIACAAGVGLTLAAVVNHYTGDHHETYQATERIHQHRE